MLAVAAEHEMGMALIPQMLIETELANGELVKIYDQKLERRRAYHLIHAHNEHCTLIARFVNWMKEELQQEPIQTESEAP